MLFISLAYILTFVSLQPIVFCEILKFDAAPDVSQLYPTETVTRQAKSLNGIWRFRLGEKGFHEKWYLHRWLDNWIPMAVPGSWQDQVPDMKLRDHVGWAFYQTDFYGHDLDRADRRNLIYFGAVDQRAIVWVNGQEVGRHSGGHVSFVVDATEAIFSSKGKSVLTVAVNNTLTAFTLPQATKTYIANATQRYPAGTWLYSHGFDYFDYSGINRNVILYSVPDFHITEILANAFYDNDSGSLYVNVEAGNQEAPGCEVRIIDANGHEIILSNDNSCTVMSLDLSVTPWTIGEPYLYTLWVNASNGNSWDVYERPIGFRTVEVKGRQILINNSTVYLHGVGMHEDADIRGRGWDAATAVRDMALLKWMGVNGIRTSHYPYSEELLQEFDKAGIAVILELPACTLSSFGNKTLEEHIRVAKEVVLKYRHHPSIIAWSMANEPQSSKNESKPYFMAVSSVIRDMDFTRPVTFVSSQQPTSEKSLDAVDIICVNRYSAWYQDAGRLDLIQYQVDHELREWAKHGKPLIITEYGAGTVPGQHTLPAEMWSEDYQTILLQEHFKAFDKLRAEGLLTGEMIWNFHDFNTPQETIRPGLCSKGLVTRQRQPKLAAYFVRQRFKNLTNYKKIHSPWIE